MATEPKPELNYEQAYARDTAHGAFLTRYDEDKRKHLLCGSETNYCYAAFEDSAEAIKECNRMNRVLL